MRAKILRKYWTFIVKPLGRHKQEGHNVDGLCDPVIAKNREIWIDSRLDGIKLLETIIHETLHACDQSQVGFVHSEDWVHNVAHDMAKVIDKFGFKRVQDE